jgi:hypothetical protein
MTTLDTNFRKMVSAWNSAHPTYKLGDGNFIAVEYAFYI